MTGDQIPPDHQPPGPPPPAPTHVGPSRGVVIALGVLIVVVVFGVAAIIGYLVLGRSDSGGSFPTAAPGVTSVTVTPSEVSAAPSPTSTAPTTTRSKSSTRSSTPVTTAAGAPEGSRPCPILSGPTGLYRASSVGSSVTSCGFAEQVRLAYAASGRPGQLPRTITATSPETGARIQMMCAAQGQRVTCNGGDDALVYLY